MFHIKIHRDGVWTDDIDGTAPEANRFSSTEAAIEGASFLYREHDLKIDQVAIFDLVEGDIIGTLDSFVWIVGEIHDHMRDLNSNVAPGSECQAYADFVREVCDKFGGYPDQVRDLIVPQTFGEYWTAVGFGESDDYDGNGARKQ